MSLDLTTLLWAMQSTSIVLAAAVLVVQWRTHPQDGLALWGWGLLLHALSYPAFGLRMAGWTATSILLSNLLSTATIALHTLAVAQFQRGRARPVSPSWILVPVAVATVSAALLLGEDRVRNVVAALIQTLQSAWFAALAWGPGLGAPRERGRWLLIVGSGTLAAMFAVRSVAVATVPWAEGITVPADIQAATYFVVLLVQLLNTLGFVLMQRERQEVLRLQEAHRHQEHLEAMVQARTTELSVAKEAAESANRAKTQFLATVSHELRTPLHGILGFTELALGSAQQPRQRECLTTALRLSRHLASVIDDLLEVTRIEAHRLELADEPLTLGRVLDSVRLLKEPAARAKGLGWQLDVEAATAAMPLRGDERRLAQVLLNLVDNAIKFTEAGSVSVRVQALRVSDGEARLRIDVVDTGPGIAVKDQARIFAGFEQLDQGAARRHGGTGLGLYIANRLVQAMGGHLTLHSAPGAGSTFSLTLSLRRDTGTGATTEAGTSTPAHEASAVATPGHAAATPQTGSAPDLDTGLASLARLLEAGDLAARADLGDLLAHAEPATRQALAPLQARVDAFDFDGALEALRALQARRAGAEAGNDARQGSAGG